MESIVEQLQLKDIDKSTWLKYRFDQIAKNVSERVEPTTTDLEIYVGLEHIDSDSIHIKRYGKREDVNGTKLRCYPGDVIFGRRRAYQRKAAIVEFDGFCSAHSLVLRANPDVISPRLFPFFLHSDTFMHRAVDISVGSLSPTINWGDLKKQEFLLPPKDQQEQIAELLWAGDEMVQKNMDVLSTQKDLFESSRNSIFSIDSAEFSLNILRDSIFNEKHFDKFLNDKTLNGIYKSKEYQGKGVRIINMGELFAYPVIRDEDMSLIDLTDKEKKQYLVEEGDLLFARRSLVIEGAGKCAIIGEHSSPMTFESSMIRARLDTNKMNPKFVFHFLKSKEGRKRIRRIVGFTTVAGITSTDLAKVKIPFVSIESQNKIVTYLEQFEDVFRKSEELIKSSKKLQKSIINQIF